MSQVAFYRDERVPFFEIKLCDTKAISYRYHTHEEHSLGVVEKGESVFWCNGKSARIKPKSMVFIPADLLHSCNPDETQEWKYKMVFFQDSWIQALLGANEGCKGWEEVFHTPYISYDKEYLHVNKLIEYLTGKLSPMEKETQIIECMSEVFKSICGGWLAAAKDESEDAKLKIVEDYLLENYRENVTLDELGSVSGLSKFYLIRKFKDKYFIPPHTYQTLLRINFAKKELKRQRPVSEVGQEAGFYDQSHFVKVFRQYVGSTPQQYQRPI